MSAVESESRLPRAANGEPVAVVALGKSFVPSDIEKPLYDRWVERGYFTGHPHSGRPPFLVVIPPPNVTGSLHIGHAFEHTLIDITVRRRRMQGYDAVWLPGMDHAGIATQNVVERELRQEGIDRRDLGRERFVAKVWDWKRRSGGMILDQMRRLGDGVDWTRERFTMDEGLSRSVRLMFKQLYDDDLIYRAERIINWCPRCQTALSDIEVEHSEDEGELVELIYGDLTGATRIVVATTRAETMLGDTAVAVHPDDDRYKFLVGQTVELPLTGRQIPVVADAHVDPSFGTGAVKITPAHDPNDFEVASRHGLSAITIMTEDAVIEGTGTRFDGLDRFAARQQVLVALRELGRTGVEKRPFVHAVGHCSRCNTVIEPRLSLQWFVRVEPLAKAAGDAVRDGQVRIHPVGMAGRWFGWVDDMHDWCISRQLWWGHRIPIWYGPDGELACLGPDEAPPPGWEQDTDVLDTWFSSALWPFSTLGWPETTDDLARYYPNSVLITGYDILFFWVARMMMFGLYAMDGRPPFPQIVLHGMVRDAQGKKMSKSSGNVVNPIEWMDAYGSDAVRFTFARGANPGADVPIGEERVQSSRSFCTKLFNAVRFALISGATVIGPLPDTPDRSTSDRWILSRLGEVLAEIDKGYEDFEFARVSEALYHFVWDEVCDWYLEMAKVSLGRGGVWADSARRVLGEVFDVVLRLLHPVMPFITEVLWLALTDKAGKEESLVVAAWPVSRRGNLDRDVAAMADVAHIQRVTTEVRRYRADQGIHPSRRIPARLTGGLTVAQGGESDLEEYVRSMARLSQPGEGLVATTTIEVESTRVELDITKNIDVEAERVRLQKNLTVAQQIREASQARLANESFLAKAPVAVVAEIRLRLASSDADIERLSRRLESLAAIR